MTISDLISELEAVRNRYGDLTVEIMSNAGLYTDLNLVEVRKPVDFPPCINIKRLTQ